MSAMAKGTVLFDAESTLIDTVYVFWILFEMPGTGTFNIHESGK